jgi:saccharopine dehydrogenase (NAD+, L-lysine-forming)
MKIGLIREGKVPPDKRVALLPEQCVELMQKFPQVSLIIQPSPIRCVPDDEYLRAGLILGEDMSHCDILLGIKEVPIVQLIPDKTYFFFSHTLKKQKHNQALLRAVLDKNITLLDYECLTNEKEERIIAFGRYAGIVGAYNGILTYGKRYGLFDLKPAHACFDLIHLQEEYKKVKLPPIKIVMTGGGRVGKGAMEVLDALGIRKVLPIEFLKEKFTEPVYAQLNSRDYHVSQAGKKWDSADFYRNPASYDSDFLPYSQVANMLITTAYWNPQAPVLFTKEDTLRSDFRLRIIADVSCDVDGSVPCTIRSTTIDAPVFDYNPFTGKEDLPFSGDRNITVMATDNLPCELPRDASGFFGRQLIDNILPHFFNGDAEGVLQRARMTQHGKLTERFAYLSDYAGVIEIKE